MNKIQILTSAVALLVSSSAYAQFYDPGKERGQYSSQKSRTYKESIANDSDDSNSRNSNYFEFFYSAATFDDVKQSGSYGIGMHLIPWEIVRNTYLGVYASPGSMNFGLVDKDLYSDIIKLGPSISYYFTPTVCVSLPVVAMCAIHGTSSKTSWGMSFMPTVYGGSHNWSLFAGPMFSLGFEGGSEMNAGFRAGICWN